MEAGIQECLASGEDISALNTAGEQKARFCALQCLKNAIHLINYMHRRSTPRVKNRELWWWDPYRELLTSFLFFSSLFLFFFLLFLFFFSLLLPSSFSSSFHVG